MRHRRRARAALLSAVAVALALPVSIVALAVNSAGTGLLFGLRLIAATCASSFAWQGTEKRY